MRPRKSATRAPEEIATEIMGLLGQQGDGSLKDEVDWCVAYMRKRPHLPPNGFRKENAKFAGQLKKWAEKGKQLCESIPYELRLELFSDPNEEKDEATELRVSDEFQKFLFLLEEMCRECERIIGQRYGEHGRAGVTEMRAAAAARRLCEETGLRVAYSSSTSCYRRVASLLYEAAGFPAQDLERACERIATVPPTWAFNEINQGWMEMMPLIRRFRDRKER